MNILITAGGTSENIDEVRRITNTGTGRLGAMVADAFAGLVPESRIVYICNDGAILPEAAVDVRIADDVDSVETAVRGACAEFPFDIIVHSMAISDFRVRAVCDADSMAERVHERRASPPPGDTAATAEAVREVLLSPHGIRESKISSDKEALIVVLEKAPKIISLLRGLAADAVIVGFKLLAGAEEDELIEAGLNLLKLNDCDFVLANDMKTVRGESGHEGLLVARDGSYERAVGKSAIAAMIAQSASRLKNARE